MKKKSICVLIANRTNYTKLKPVMTELNNLNYFNIKVVVSSSGILKKYGNISEKISEDGFKVDSLIDNLLMNDKHSSMGISLGLSCIQFSTYLENNKTDIILTVGDRFDMLGPVISAKYMNLDIIHLQGGEKSGSIDDTIRNQISLCSSLHFVATEKSKDNLLKLGIDSKQVFNFGCTAVDHLLRIVSKESKYSDIKFKTKYTPILKNNEQYFVLLLHPNTVEEKVVLKTVFNAIDRFNKKVFLFYPNIDASNSSMLSDLQTKLSDPKYVIIKNLKMKDFSILVKNSICFIGNSSSGIRESASFKVPFINIGNRQKNREQNNNTINCPFNEDEIFKAINRAFKLKDKLKGENIYYKENSSKLISKKIFEIYA